MKRKTKMIILFMLILSIFFTTVPIPAEGTGSAMLKLENSPITVMVGRSFDVPLYIENNHGIMGFDIIVEYDKNYVEPIEVNAGNVLKDETLNDSIDTSITNSFHVMWAGTDNVTADGELFTIKFNLKRNAESGSTSMKLTTVLP